MQPKILLFGEAGSGKDTVAQYLVEKYGAVALAMADPMKRLAAAAFGFTEDQLWGPSANRNAVDRRFSVTEPDPNDGSRSWSRAWHDADLYIGGPDSEFWVQEVCGYIGKPREQLIKWFKDLKVHSIANGGQLTPRLMLQTLGTEWGRAVHDQLWINYAQRVQGTLLKGGYAYDRTKGLVKAPGVHFNLVVVTDGRFPNEALEFKQWGSTVIRIRGSSDTGAAQAAGVQGHASETAQGQMPDRWFDAILENRKTDGLVALQWTIDGLMRWLRPPMFSTSLLDMRIVDGQEP